MIDVQDVQKPSKLKVGELVEKTMDLSFDVLCVVVRSGFSQTRLGASERLCLSSKSRVETPKKGISSNNNKRCALIGENRIFHFRLGFRPIEFAIIRDAKSFLVADLVRKWWLGKVNSVYVYDFALK